MSIAIIRNFFQAKIAIWAAANSVQVAYENVPFTPTVGVSFVECHLMPANTIMPTIKGDRFREVGIFQVSIYTSTNIGTALIDGLVQSLVETFPVVPKGVVSVESHPYAHKIGIEQNGWECVAVSIPYRLES